MASNLLGAFGGFLEAFTRSKEAKQSREENEKYKKAMTQLLELQIDGLARQTDARTKIGQMAAPQRVGSVNPQFQFPEEGALGEIQQTQASGPVVKPGMSFMDIMGDPDGRLAMLESGMSEQMLQADQQLAQSELVQAMQASGLPPLEFLQSKEGGALAVRAGMNPSEFLRMQQGAADPLQTLLAQELLDQRRLANQRAEAEAAQEDATLAADRETTESTLLRSIGQTATIADLTDKLEDSFLKPGVPASSLRRAGVATVEGIGSVLGFETGGLRTDLDNFDKLKKNMADQLNNLIATGGFDNITDSKLRQYQDSLSSTETSPGAIMSIQGNIAQILLDKADALKIPVPNREEVEANIERWHSYETPAGETRVDAPALGRQIAAIAKMSAAQLGELANQAEGLAPEVLEAAARRWDEIHAR